MNARQAFQKLQELATNPNESFGKQLLPLAGHRPTHSARRVPQAPKELKEFVHKHDPDAKAAMEAIDNLRGKSNSKNPDEREAYNTARQIHEETLQARYVAVAKEVAIASGGIPGIPSR